MDFLTHGTEGTEYELRGLYRLKSCGGGPFEDLAMIDHLVSTILSVPHNGVRIFRGPESG